MDQHKKPVESVELPAFIRAFGVKMPLVIKDKRPYYSEYKSGVGAITVEQCADGNWLATVRLSNATISNGVTSSSIPAALRSLRGCLRNLAIDLDRLGIKPR